MREPMSFPTVSSKPVRYDAPFGSPESLDGTVDPRGVFFFAAVTIGKFVRLDYDRCLLGV